MRYFIYNLVIDILAFAMFIILSLVNTGITSLLLSLDKVYKGKTNYICVNNSIRNYYLSYGFYGNITVFCLLSYSY
jgi:hypothetical protein